MEPALDVGIPVMVHAMVHVLGHVCQHLEEEHAHQEHVQIFVVQDAILNAEMHVLLYVHNLAVMSVEMQIAQTPVLRHVLHCAERTAQEARVSPIVLHHVLKIAMIVVQVDVGHLVVQHQDLV